jgi:threonine dehydratase
VHQVTIDNIRAAAGVIQPVFRESPQFLSRPLSRELGCELAVKVETFNPLGSFKGRGADFFLSRYRNTGTPIVCASAGNFGQGIAYCARRRGISAIVFAAENANPLKVDRMRSFGAHVELRGRDFDDAKSHARNFAAEKGYTFVEDGREPAIAEGAGTIAVEIERFRRDHGLPEYQIALVPLGNGALLAGMAAWLKQHSPSTRVIGVCAAQAPAMALSMGSPDHSPVVTDSTNTIADGIAVRVPVPEALEELQGRIDEVITVGEDSLITAMRLLFQNHGLVSEPAGAAGLAALVEYSDRFKGARIVTPICGSNITSEQMRKWLLR